MFRDCVVVKGLKLTANIGKVLFCKFEKRKDASTTLRIGKPVVNKCVLDGARVTVNVKSVIPKSVRAWPVAEVRNEAVKG